MRASRWKSVNASLVGYKFAFRGKGRMGSIPATVCIDLISVLVAYGRYAAHGTWYIARPQYQRHPTRDGRQVDCYCNTSLDRRRGGGKGRGTMQLEARSKRMDAVVAHPLAELLACPPATGGLLTASARSIEFGAGEIIFRQYGPCLGLSLVVSGQLLRRTERLETRLTLGSVRPGDLVELAASLGDLRHTSTLVAQTAGSLLVLPIEALNLAFQS